MSNSTIESCTVSPDTTILCNVTFGEIPNAAGGIAGGIAGLVLTSGKVTNCTSNAVISGNPYVVGGIAGSAANTLFSGNHWTGNYKEVGQGQSSGTPDIPDIPDTPDISDTPDTPNNNNRSGISSSSGGCSSGINSSIIFMMIFSLIGLKKSRRH